MPSGNSSLSLLGEEVKCWRGVPPLDDSRRTELPLRWEGKAEEETAPPPTPPSASSGISPAQSGPAKSAEGPPRCTLLWQIAEAQEGGERAAVKPWKFPRVVEALGLLSESSATGQAAESAAASGAAGAGAGDVPREGGAAPVDAAPSGSTKAVA
jgi:hypothetical protein